MKLKEQFEEGWFTKLSPFFASEAFHNIGSKLMSDVSEGKVITPSLDNTFRAFKECPYKDLKVVMLGQDPYPGRGVADGLAFSARNHQLNPPKSIAYIMEAIEKDVYNGFGIGYNQEYLNSNLTRWANQGVLLLNTSLSTYEGLTGAHIDLWIPFIQYVFKTLKEYNTGIIYILLGAHAKQWTSSIDKTRNHILTASHPASCAYKGLKEWDSNSVFSKANEILIKSNGESAKILW